MAETVFAVLAAQLAGRESGFVLTDRARGDAEAGGDHGGVFVVVEEDVLATVAQTVGD